LENWGLKPVRIDSVYVDYGSKDSHDKRYKHQIEGEFYLGPSEKRKVSFQLPKKNLRDALRKFGVDQCYFYLRVSFYTPTGTIVETTRPLMGLGERSTTFFAQKGEILYREKGTEGMQPPIAPPKFRDLWDWLQILGPYFVGLVAFLIGFKDQILNFLRGPRLDMLFDQHEEGYYHQLLHNPLEEIHDPVTNTRYIIRQPGFNSRVIITNKGKTTARKVEARLVDIIIYDNKKEFVKREVYHPSLIKWSGEKEYHPVDIPRESKFFLDLFYAVSETREDILRYHGELGESTLQRILGDTKYSGDVFWNAWIDTSYPRGIPPKYTVEGHFELNFIVYAENCKPHKFAVSVDWDKQKWNRPDIKRIKV
jgi:hypothetical protein